jgi:hypothetical protein
MYSPVSSSMRCCARQGCSAYIMAFCRVHKPKRMKLEESVHMLLQGKPDSLLLDLKSASNNNSRMNLNSSNHQTLLIRLLAASSTLSFSNSFLKQSWWLQRRISLDKPLRLGAFGTPIPNYNKLQSRTRQSFLQHWASPDNCRLRRKIAGNNERVSRCFCSMRASCPMTTP